MFSKKRSDIEIIGEILSLSKGGARKTEILYQCNLSFTQCNKYLTYLIDKNILDKKIIKNVSGNIDNYYRTTEKGLTLLEEINKTLFYFW